jgi:glutamate--cysteine ligase
MTLRRVSSRRSVAPPRHFELEQYVRNRVFRGARTDEAALRVGIEVEFIPVGASDRLPTPVENDRRSGFADLLRAHGSKRGWLESRSSKGAPVFVVRGKGTFTFEPGGQVEFSTVAETSANPALDALDEVLLPLTDVARERDIEILHVGIDPLNDIARVPLRICAPRYLAMQEYFDSIGPYGVRMMRQTAAHQVNLDFGAHPDLRWRVLNRLTPYVIAMFANSRQYRGADTGHASTRADVWRRLDPARTGIFPEGDDASRTYLDFALGAPLMTQRGSAGEYRPFADWLADGMVAIEDWEEHLTTLFPEVRPKGYLEVRSADAISPEWYAAPVALLAGLVYSERALVEVEDLLPEADEALLVQAGRSGLKDAAIASVARDVGRLALEGCVTLGERFISGAHLERARTYFEIYTQRGRSPASQHSVEC